jgi:sortase (surface protein transpeptidase)
MFVGARMHTNSGYVLVCVMILCLACIVSACDPVFAQGTGPRMPEEQEYTNIATPVATKRTPVADIPSRLIIPSIKVDAAVESVGLLANGDLDTPKAHPWTDVGWYANGTRPGERGSAVIDGHLDRPGGLPAVFWSLRDLHTGDKLEVIMTSGKQLHFHVTYTASYNPQNAPLQGIFGDAGGVYLNLITCAGDWIPSQHQTTLRTVVYTSAD